VEEIAKWKHRAQTKGEQLEACSLACDKLNEQLQECRSVVEFYADTDSWWWGTGADKDYMDVIPDSDMQKVPTTGRAQGYETVGGKRARALKSKMGWK